jgi:hypothetical protein
MAAAGVSTAAGYGRMAHGAQVRTMDFAEAFCYTRPTRRPGFSGIFGPNNRPIRQALYEGTMRAGSRPR